MYIYLRTDDTFSPVEIHRHELHDRVHELCDCECFETVYFTAGKFPGERFVLLVDDEGKLIDPPKEINRAASCFYRGSEYGDPIVGDVLICREIFDGFEHDLGPLTDDQREFFVMILQMLDCEEVDL